MSTCKGTVVELLELVDRAAPAIVVPDGRASYSYGQIDSLVTRLAGTLHEVGVRRGDRVALAVPDGPQFVTVLLAALAAGATVAPLNPAYTESEIGFYLGDIAPRILLLPVGMLPAARAAALAAEIAVVDVAGEDLLVGGRRIANPGRFADEAPGSADMALLLHTSGTTSVPKQVPLLHRNLVASARTISAFYELGPEDVAYCAMPLFHVHGLVATVLATIASGGTVVVPRRFTPRGLLDHLEPHGVTWFSAAPTIHTMILERDAKAGRRAPSSRLRFLRSCSSALPEHLRVTLEDRFGSPVVEAYGMTEASHQIASNPLPPGRRVAGSTGVATGTELAVVEGEVLKHQGHGEVVIRGPNVTPGYLSHAETASAAFCDGWLRTGDLGTIDGDGYLRLEGRIKEMVIRGGENVSPYEVENVLASHSAVREAACFGVPDDKYGEEVAAAIVLAADAEVGEILAYCNERLAAFKTPKKLYVVDAIPRTATGKLQRQRLPAALGIESTASHVG